MGEGKLTNKTPRHSWELPPEHLSHIVVCQSLVQMVSDEERGRGRGGESLRKREGALGRKGDRERGETGGLVVREVGQL